MTQGEVGGHQKMTDDNDSSFRGRGLTFSNKNGRINHDFSKKLLLKGYSFSRPLCQFLTPETEP